MMANDCKTPEQRAKSIVLGYSEICRKLFGRVTVGNDYLARLIAIELRKDSDGKSKR